MGIKHPEIERHADRDKEQTEQQAFEGIDSRFQFMAIFTFRQ